MIHKLSDLIKPIHKLLQVGMLIVFYFTNGDPDFGLPLSGFMSFGIFKGTFSSD